MYKLKEYCRICLSSPNDITIIYTSHKERYLPNVIYNISGVKLQHKKEPNAKICHRCADAIVAAEYIILKCQESEQYLSYQQQERKTKMHLAQKVVAEPTNSQIKQNKEAAEAELMNGQCDEAAFAIEIELMNSQSTQKNEATFTVKTEQENTKSMKSNTIEYTSVKDELGLFDIFETSEKEDSSRESKKLKNVSIGQERNECQHCCYRSNSRICLVDHYRIAHNLDENSMYKCSMCEETFSWRRTLFLHVEKIHKTLPEERRFTCNECGKAYFRKHFLDDHIRQRHRGMAKKFDCPQPGCGKSFNRKFTLQRHLAAMHSLPSHIKVLYT